MHEISTKVVIKTNVEAEYSASRAMHFYPTSKM